jgi:hypothetical protein
MALSPITVIFIVVAQIVFIVIANLVMDTIVVPMMGLGA